MSQTETATHQTAVTEQFTYLFRRGVSGYVKIFRLLPSNRSRTPPPTSRFVSRFIEPVHYLQGIFTDIFAGNSMLLTRDHRHLWTGDCLFSLAFLAA